MWVPEALGGAGASFGTFVDSVVEVSRVDGSAGWVLFVHAAYGALAAYLEPPVAMEVYGSPSSIVAGSLNPTGTAAVVEGGYRVTGRWTFGSGISHASWVLGNCITAGDGDGPPRAVIVLFPREQCQVHDTWRVSGLAGTGSHDYSAEDVFVPATRTVVGMAAVPRHLGALYAAPFITLFATTVAAPALGMARGAIDAALEVAGRKTATGSSVMLRDRPSAQAALARAEGLVQAGRAGLVEAVTRMVDKAGRGGVTMRDRALVRIAAAHAASSAVGAVDLAFDVAGSTANELDSPLQRFSRDVRAATQHIAVVANNFEIAGRVLVGLEPGTPRF
jgi:alkylation response protein AidB-like acyl-CoA dehydrogenase